jgi:hypothetical protein
LNKSNWKDSANFDYFQTSERYGIKNDEFHQDLGILLGPVESDLPNGFLEV